MAKLKVIIGNIDIQTDSPEVAGNLIRNLMNGLLDIELDHSRPVAKPKKLTKSKPDGG